MKTQLKSAFTLIELLVVIAIIAILAAVLLPSLGRARELARGSACLNNLHNLGTALNIYTTNNDSFFPSTYNYLNGSTSGVNTLGIGGYHHWTAMIEPENYKATTQSGTYPRTANQYVCPNHQMRGFAPTNFTLTRIPNPPPGQATQTAAVGDDQQAPRISYVPNEAIMPRKKLCDWHDANYNPTLPSSDPFSATTRNLCYVGSEEIQNPGNTILLAEFSSSANCIYGGSVTGGAAYKSHRPTNGVWTESYDSDGTGKMSTIFDGEQYERIKGKKIYKLTTDMAMTSINNVLADQTKGAGEHHISYINPEAHNDGSNYLFVDGHASKLALQKTLDPGNFMWGAKMYSCSDKPVIEDAPTTP